MDFVDRIGFVVLAGVDLMSVVTCPIVLTWAAVRDCREMLRR
jgi:hypothetical protein